MSKFPKIYGQDNGRLGEAKGKLRTLKVTMTSVPFASASAHGAYRVSKAGEHDAIELLGGEDGAPERVRLHSVLINTDRRSRSNVFGESPKKMRHRHKNNNRIYSYADANGALNSGTIRTEDVNILTSMEIKPGETFQPVAAISRRTLAVLVCPVPKRRVLSGGRLKSAELPAMMNATPPEARASRPDYPSAGVFIPQLVGFFPTGGRLSDKCAVAVCIHEEGGEDYWRRPVMSPVLCVLDSEGVFTQRGFSLPPGASGCSMIAGTPIPLAPGRFAVLVCQRIHPSFTEVGPGGRLWLYIFKDFGGTVEMVRDVGLPPEMLDLMEFDTAYMASAAIRGNRPEGYFEYSTDYSITNMALWNMVNGSGVSLDDGSFLWVANFYRSGGSSSVPYMRRGVHAWVISESGEFLHHHVLWDPGVLWEPPASGSIFRTVNTSWSEFTPVNGGAVIIRVRAIRDTSIRPYNPVKFFITHDQGRSFEELSMDGVDAELMNDTVGRISVLDRVGDGVYSLLLPTLNGDEIVYYHSLDNGQSWSRAGRAKTKALSPWFTSAYWDSVRTGSDSPGTFGSDNAFVHGGSQVFVMSDPRGMRVPCDQIRPWIYYPEYKRPERI